MSAIGVPPLGLTIGALFIGVILSMGCWGAAVVQVYRYFERYPRDRCVFKLLVIVVFLLDTVHQALITVVLYKYLISEYGNFSFLNTSLVELNITILLNCMIVLLVQSFFVWRILSEGNRFISTILGTLVVAQFVLGLVYFSKVYNLRTFSGRNKEYSIVCINTAVSAVGDAAIACTLVYLLHRSRTGFKRNEQMINRLIVIAINAGLPTVICAIAGTITVMAIRKSFVYLVFYFLGGRLYTNSFIAALNCRKLQHRATFSESTANGNSAEGMEALSLTRLRVRAEPVDSATPRVVNIRVDTETEEQILDLDGQRLMRPKASSLRVSAPPLVLNII